MEKKARLHIRISDTFAEKIKTAAEAEQKTITEYVLDLIKKDLVKKGMD